MFCTDITDLKYLIFSSQTPALLYYSHIPSAVIALVMAFFVYIKGRKTLTGRILVYLSATFSIWVTFNLIAWTNNDSRLISFTWSFFEILSTLMFILCLSFVYAYIDKKTMPLGMKIPVYALLASVAVISPTRYNIQYFNIVDCEAVQNALFINYIYIVQFVILLLIVGVLAKKFIKADRVLKKQIFYLGAGILLFLFAFFVTTFIAVKIDNFQLEQYGLFGMVAFMAFLAYLIVRFKAFDIKMIATQALVIGLIILTGSEFFFAKSATNQVLIGTTLAISVILGYQLVKSVQREVKRKEQLESLSGQLAQTNDKLHQLDKAKSEFISIASHQLRTPLTAIKGFVSLLLEGTYGRIPEAQRPALEKVYISNERLVQLVEDLLNISRIEAGRMEFDFQRASLEDLADEAVKTLELSAKTKKLYLEWKKPAEPTPEIRIDITKVKEVVSNMIDNAIKYTPKGGVTARVERGTFFDHSDMRRKSVVRFVVSDTGIGMDKEEIENIFRKFERGKEVAHYHTDGTGLGMYIGKKIVEAHHGRIWAESEGKGRGSKFILELPVG